MQFRGLLAVVVLGFACLSAVAEPKAYEVVKYKGKAEGVTIALDFCGRLSGRERDEGHGPEEWKEHTIRLGR